MLTCLINAYFRFKHVVRMWKISEIIMLLNPGQPLTEVKSYRPIYPLSTI